MDSPRGDFTPITPGTSILGHCDHNIQRMIPHFHSWGTGTSGLRVEKGKARLGSDARITTYAANFCGMLRLELLSFSCVAKISRCSSILTRYSFSAAELRLLPSTKEPRLDSLLLTEQSLCLMARTFTLLEAMHTISLSTMFVPQFLLRQCQIEKTLKLMPSSKLQMSRKDSPRPRKPD